MAAQFNEPMFDLLSYARRGPGRRDSMSPADIQQIARTVGRTPEVMVKILSRGANNLTAVRKHLNYIGRKGEVEIETDDGDKRPIENLLNDWDLELDEFRPQAKYPRPTAGDHRGSSTRCCSRCPPGRLRRRSSRLYKTSVGRNSLLSTDMPWRCIPTNRILTSTS